MVPQNGQQQRIQRVALKGPRQPNHRLLELRRNRGWSRAKLSYESGGVSTKTIQDIEEGWTVEPRVGTMFKLATALRTTVTDLDRDKTEAPS